MTRRSRLAITAVLTIVLSAWIGARQPPQSAPHSPAASVGKEPKDVVWRRAIDQHRPGQADDPLRAIASWSREDLELALSGLLRREHGTPRNAVLRKAAILHLDIAMLVPATAVAAKQAANVTVFRDGQVVGRGVQTFHWEFGRALLDAIDPRPGDPEDLAWYRASTAVMEASRDYSQAEPHLARALKIFPADPALLMYAGTLHEAYAEPRVQHAPVVSHPLALIGTTHIGTTRAELDRAVQLFRQALDADPGLTEARVRLGHALSEAGFHVEAAAELARALEQAETRWLRFDALLFVGREALAAGRTDTGMAAVRQAILVQPQAASARVLLSALAHARGDRTEAVAMLGPPEPANPPAVDPWLVYTTIHDPSAAEQIRQLRGDPR